MAAESIFTDEEIDELDDTWESDSIWNPESTELEDETAFTRNTASVIQRLPAMTPSEFTSKAFMIPRTEKTVNEDGEEVERVVMDRFSFEGRRHMYRCYDTPAKNVLLFCGRQVEKCVSQVANGNLVVYTVQAMPIPAFDIEVGTELLSWDEEAGKVRGARVVAKKRVGSKPCLRITTRQGHELRVAETHPILTATGWVEARDLGVGSRVGAIRRGGAFGRWAPDSSWVTLLAYLIADGNLGTSGEQLSFSKQAGVVCADFYECLRARYDGADAKQYPRAVGSGVKHNIAHGEQLKEDLRQVGLWGCYSAEKFIPDEVFSYNRESTALFLNRLWACDGSVGQVSGTKYDIEYASISLRLVRGVQALLWKFGIPTSFRKYKPKAYEGTDKWSYILRVETRTGIKRFLTEVGALGKSENISLPDESAPERNNRDSIPSELVTRYVQEALPPGMSLRSVGIDRFPRSGVTQDRVRTLVSLLEQAGSKKAALKPLRTLLDSDLYWDEIETIENVGEEPCFDIEVEGTHNFLLSGVFTHNSTLLGNTILSYMALIAGYRALYVSPSQTQSKTFSADRIKEPLETSHLLRKLTTTMLSQNVLEKQFINRSKLTLRYAYLNADRTRGIPAYLLAIDEFQDILQDNVPVMEQCLSHAPKTLKRKIYSGTPKSLDNHLEHYRANLSTQGEWVVPCEGCNFWNVLCEKNIGKFHLICERCGKQIYPMHPKAQWANMVADAPWESYRIPQLMVPWLDWKRDILYNYENYPRDKFNNEVMGISYDSGMRPITSGQLRMACVDEVSMQDFRHYRDKEPVYMGLDHGTGEHSYTVVTLGTYVNGKFRIIYCHRFIGEDVDPELQMAKVLQIIRWMPVRLVGSDYGGGFANNYKLIKEIGAQRVRQFQYVARAKAKIQYNPKQQRWAVSRTELMSSLFNAIKAGKIELPNWKEFKDPYAADVLSIFSEYNETLKMIQYKHSPDKPDDTFHSILYCLMASMFDVPRPDIVAPDFEDATGRRRNQVIGSTNYQG